MPLLVASLLRVVFSLILREIDFFNFLYLSKYITIFLMGSKWRRVCGKEGKFSHNSLKYSCKQQSVKITCSSVTLSWTVCRKGYSSAYCLTYSLLSCFSPKVLRSVLYGSQHKWSKRAKYSPFIRPQKSVLSVLHPSLRYLVGLPVHKPECVWWMSGTCK
jgi:hypothetical protein